MQQSRRTRARLTAAVIGSILASGLVACGSDDGGDDAGDGVEMRSYTDSRGENLEIPADPQRIVSLSDYAAGHLLAIGAPVVGVTFELEGSNWDALDVSGITTVPDMGEAIDFEGILELEPDLIVSNTNEGEPNQDSAAIARLGEIAPLVYFETAASPDAEIPHDIAMDFADVANVDTAVVEAQKAEYEAVLAEIEELLGSDRGELEVGMLMAWEDEFGAPTTTWAAPMVRVLADAGVTWTPEAKPDDWLGIEGSYERLRELQVDLLVVGSDPYQLDSNPLFQDRPEVEAGQVIYAERFYLSHYPDYTACAESFLESLQAMEHPLRSDIVG